MKPSLLLQIKRILDICTNYGIIHPTFEEVQTGFRVSIFKEKIKSYVNVPENVTENVTENNRFKRIIELIKNDNKITTTNIAKILQVTRRTIARDLDNMKSNGLIKRIGPDKGGYWKVLSQ